MNARALKPRNNNYQPAAYRPAQSIVHNSAAAKQFNAYQEMANNMPQVKQLRTYQAMADRYTSSMAKPVIQRAIGAGGEKLHGKKVVDAKDNLYVIDGHRETRTALKYNLKYLKNKYIWVDAWDDDYDLYNKEVMEEEPKEQPERSSKKRARSSDTKEPPKKKRRKSIKFTVARRDKGPRTRTTFTNSKEAIKVLMEEGLSKKLATSLVAKDDWSYPTMRSLMETLQEQGILQPGLQEGANLWTQHQEVGEYKVETTDTGSQLAQIVGCHLLEYQETNNGTMGPRQKKETSRKKQLSFSKEILKLPPQQVTEHSLGLGLPPFVNLFPGMFDTKYEDNEHKVFSKTAGALTFKLFQKALKERDQQFGHEDTLNDQSRKDRKDTVKRVLREQQFDVDQLDRFKDEKVDYLKTYMGIKDTDSDDSFDETEGWESPYTIQKVRQWTLREFYDNVYKQNVYSGVLLKDTASKLAELDVLELQSKPGPKSTTGKKLTRTRSRRRRVQSRVGQVNESLRSIMQALDIDIVKAYTRVKQWKTKSSMLASIKTDDQQKALRIAKYQQSLDDFISMKLVDMKKKDYPAPLDGVGEKTLEDMGAVKPAKKRRGGKKKIVVEQ